MDEHESFLAAILRDPDQPEAYLIYADWLEEQGDPRGEFIRLQWRRETGTLTSRETFEQIRQEAQYERAHKAELLGEFGPVMLDPRVAPFCIWQTGRGFVDELYLQQLQTEVGDLLRESRWSRFLRTLRIVDTSGVRNRADEDQLYLPAPDPGVFHRDESNLELIVDGDFRNLRRLEVRSSYLTARRDYTACVNLVRRLPRLESLGLWIVGHVAFEDLLTLPLPNLRALRLENFIEPFPLELIARNPSLRKLECLTLSVGSSERVTSGPTESALQVFCASPYLTALKSLRIQASTDTDAFVSGLVTSGIYQRLSTLDLTRGNLSASGAEMLINAGVGHLESLDVRYNRIASEEVRTQLESIPQVTCNPQQADPVDYTLLDRLG